MCSICYGHILYDHPMGVMRRLLRRCGATIYTVYKFNLRKLSYVKKCLAHLVFFILYQVKACEAKNVGYMCLQWVLRITREDWFVNNSWSCYYSIYNDGLLCLGFVAHDAVINSKHFPEFWHFVWGIHPSQRPVTWSCGIFFDLRLNKRLSIQSWGWWFEIPSRLLWSHCYASALFGVQTKLLVIAPDSLKFFDR